MGTSTVSEKQQGAYGQVYWCGMQDGGQWRGILMDDEHAEVWVGRPKESPDKAFAAMKKEAKRLDIGDLRPWSG